MRYIGAMLVGLGSLLLLSTAAQATPNEGAPNTDLLAFASSSAGAALVPMSAEELGAVRGEGTITKSFDVPQLRRSFEKVFNFNDTTITIVGVAGVGITLTVDSPRIP
jgi:hypothetical protein